MAEIDSGVDTGSESNESNSMSVELPRLEEEKSNDTMSQRFHVPVVPPAVVNPFGNLPLAYCSYDYNDNRQHDHLKKMRVTLHRRNLIKSRTGFYPNTRFMLGERELRKMARTNSLKQAQNLLDNGVDPCARDEKKRTPLHFAACHGHTEMARLLIERGADPNQRDVLGNTPLHLAACTSNIEMVTLLLKAGTDVNAYNNSGRSPLHLAQSKLKLLQMNKSYSSMQLKIEVMQVLEMMQVYLQKSGQAVDADLLNKFSDRLNHHQTREEVNVDVSELLSSLSHLSLQKT